MPENPTRLATKDLTRIMDLSAHEVLPLLELGRTLKADIRPYKDQFAQRSIVMLFEKPSLRTRVSFDIGFARMGGHAVYLDHEKQRIGERETIADYSRNLERWCDCIVARTMKHTTISALAANATIPVINALSDIHHPCQALADFMTLVELGFDCRRHQLAWVGDGNNVCHSLMELTATLGASMIVVTPEGHEPSSEIMRECQARACRSGATLQYSSDIRRIRNSFAIYTDSWTSMGQVQSEQKTKAFQGYCVTPEVMALAGTDAYFMHCLPAHRGQEVTDSVIDGDRSVVFEQAENRMHIQNALLLNLLATPTQDSLGKNTMNTVTKNNPPAPASAQHTRPNTPRRVCVAYSGGLDTSCVIPWLRETYNCEVVACVADVGQGEHELVGIEKKAAQSGACKCVIKDLKQSFLTDFVFPMVMSGAVYEGRYLLGTSIARPCIAQAQVVAALEENCDAVAHGCTGKGNDQVRFESVYAALAPQLRVIAPWRESTWNLRSREAMLEYLAQRNIPCAASATKIYSRDANSWHVSHEGAELEDPWNAPPEDLWIRTTDPKLAPNEPEEVVIAFENGVPVSVNGKKLSAVELLETLNHIGARHGVGRVDMVENRLVGMKSRGCYETPGGTLLMEALRGLEQIVLDRDSMRFREELANDFARVIYDGRWFTPLRESQWAAIQSLAQPLTGEVAVRAFKGSATTTRRRSPNSLYSQAFATFGQDDVYNQQHAEGFIRLFSLPSRIRALLGIGKSVAQKTGANR